MWCVSSGVVCVVPLSALFTETGDIVVVCGAVYMLYDNNSYSVSIRTTADIVHGVQMIQFVCYRGLVPND